MPYPFSSAGGKFDKIRDEPAKVEYPAANLGILIKAEST
jgi:hypothetical protein